MATNRTAPKLPEVPVIWSAERDRVLWTLDMDRVEIADESTTLADLVDLSDTTEHVTVTWNGRRIDDRLMPIVIAMIEDASIEYPARQAVTVAVTPGRTDGYWTTNGSVAVTVDAAMLAHLSISSADPTDRWGCKLLESLVGDGPRVDLAELVGQAHPRLIAAFAAYLASYAESFGEGMPAL